MEESKQILAGRYEIRQLIGRGGMAEVRVGMDTRLNRTVAIKMLRQDLARDPVFQHRFAREAQAAANLNHPSIVAVYDTGEEPTRASDGTEVMVPYIVMEYVEGHTVRELLTDGDPVPIDEAVEIVSGVLGALEYAHKNGLVHRDIKPGNVMLTTDGKVKVMDFGIARALTDSGATMTQTDAVVGTAQYLSPEQARGEQVDTRSDLYSTGCLLFELLTGRPPFKGDSAVAVAFQHVSQLPPVPSSITPDIPEALDRVVMKSLAKNRDERYSDASHMRSDLVRALHGQSVVAPAVDTWADQTAANATTVLPPAPAQPVEPRYAGGAVRPGGSNTQVFAPVGGGSMPPAPPTVNVSGVSPKGSPVKQKEPMDKGKVALITVFSILLAMLLGFGVWWMLMDKGGGTSTEMVTVPTLEKLTKEEARRALREANLTPTESYEQNDDVEAGHVIKSDPQAGTKVEPGSSVKLFISNGPGEATIPDVTRKDQDEARKILKEAGLENIDLKVYPENVGTVEKGMVTRTDPVAGSKVIKSQEVRIYIASGSVEVPMNLVGKPQSEVLAWLHQNRLTAQITTIADKDKEPGTVVEVAPVGIVDANSIIVVTVSERPVETESPSPSESPTESESKSPSPSPSDS